MDRVLLVFVGSGLGGVLRYLVAVAMKSEQWVPILAVNLVGSLLIGLAYGWLGADNPRGVLVMTGLLGGFTTLSAMSLDTVRLVQAGKLGLAVGYPLATIIGGVALAALGMFLSGGLNRVAVP